MTAQRRLPGTRGGWPADLARYYEQQTGGRLHPGRIAKRLSPILKTWRREGCPPNPWGYDDPLDLLKLAYGRWVRSEKRKYGPEYLAREIGEFLRGPGV